MKLRKLLLNEILQLVHAEPKFSPEKREKHVVMKNIIAMVIERHGIKAWYTTENTNDWNGRMIDQYRCAGETVKLHPRQLLITHDAAL